MPLYLTEEDVEAVFEIGDALEAVEGSFRRQAAGEIENRPRDRLRLEEGALAVMAAVDLGLGVAGVKTYAAGAGGVKFVLVLFHAQRHEVLAVIEADRLGRLRTGAASGVAAKHLAKAGAVSLGVIGCGRQAETQVAAIRAALPDIATTVVYCRDPGRREAFANAVGADAAESHSEAAAQDVVVTITTSKDPVLRGEWLRPARSCAPPARTSRGAGSSTTPCWSARPSCAATPARTQSSSPAISSSPSRKGFSTGSRCTSWPRSSPATCRDGSRTTTSSSSSRTASRRGTWPPEQPSSRSRASAASGSS